VNGLALCAGIGGLDLGVSIAAPNYRTICYVEREAFAAATLVAQMENGFLAPAPIWDDLFTFDARPWRGVVDCVAAGIPCQPYSVAGKQRGHGDERALWPEFIRIVEECSPSLVFLENVANFIHFFRPVGEELSRMGYRIEAGIFSAAEVGTPHRRERFFMLAHRERARWQAGLGFDEHTACKPQAGRGELGDELPAWPPGPAEHERWAGIPRSFWPATAKSTICGMANGVPSRMDRLRALGNGVVPLQAAYAFTTLARKSSEA
jgi:DNA (cytosine-5)-methyltransferase 1